MLRRIWNERRVGHDVEFDRRQVHDPRILDTAAARPDLVRLARFEAPIPMRSTPTANFAVVTHERMTDPRIVAFGDEPRKEMHRAIRGTNASRIEDAPRFMLARSGASA